MPFYSSVNILLLSIIALTEDGKVVFGESTSSNINEVHEGNISR